MWFLDGSWRFTFDGVGTGLFLVVCGVSFFVHIYAVWYLGQDPHLVSFLGIFGRFTLSMMILVSASNLLLLFLGWEGVGICSFGLIGFWHARREAARGRLKRVVYNRIGDVCFLLGIAWLRLESGSVDLTLLERIHSGESGGNGPLFLFLRRRAAKSAQVPLQGWLADAMEGPTPVSALLHAATMVVAGVFTVVRLGYLTGEERRSLIGEVGRITRVAARVMGRRSSDRKAVIAYSTCSQLGYMMLGIGAGVVGAAMSHLFLHRRFKAALFLRAGVALHSIQDEQDLRNTRGLGRLLPVTTRVLWVNTRSLLGLPYLSGWVSKDTMLEYLRAGGSELWQGRLGILCLGGTAFYRSKSLGRVRAGPLSLPRHAVRGRREAPITVQRGMLVLCFRRVRGGVLLGDRRRSVETTEGWSESLWVDQQVVDQLFFREHQSRWAPVRLGILRWILLCAFLGFLWSTEWWLSVNLWYSSARFRQRYRLANLRLLMDALGGRLAGGLFRQSWTTLVRDLEQGALDYTFHKALPRGLHGLHQSTQPGVWWGYRWLVSALRLCLLLVLHG